MAERDASQPTNSLSGTLRRQLSEEYVERGAVEGAEARASLDRTIEQLTDSLKAVESAERIREPGGAARYPTPAPLHSLRTGLLGSGRALLTFFWGERGVYGWWVTDSSVHAARLGSPDSLAAMVDFLRSAVDDPSSGSMWEASAGRAFEKLIAPLSPDLVSEILIVPDGPLAYIPFEVLLPGKGKPPWGATRRLVYGPSASVLLALRQARRPSRWKREMLAVGNPRSRGDVAHGEGLRATLVQGPADLPYAEEEARSIGALFGPGADLLLGQNATLQHWFKSNPSQYRYLHFAAHAEFSERGSDRTDIMLAGSKLDLRSIRRLELESDLVTLSACETALGQRLRGEGIVGLPHAFLAAGAHGTVVTLWRIGDRSAADFMRDFYRELHGGQSPADALLAVRQRWSQAAGPERHPSRWAAFVLVGGI
jgi:CHAT domain-containing protein